MGEFKSKIRAQEATRRRLGSPAHQAVVKQVRARQAAGETPAPTRRKATTIFGAGRR